MSDALPSGQIDVLSLHSAGKASFQEKNGIVTVTGNDAIKALQLVAECGGIRILLSQVELASLSAAAKMKISVAFPRNDIPGAAQAAQQIMGIVYAARQRRSSNFDWKGEQGSEDETTKTVPIVRLEAEDEANAIIVFIRNWNAAATGSVIWKAGWCLLLIILVGVMFLLVISLLDAIYGTHRIGTLLSSLGPAVFPGHLL